MEVSCRHRITFESSKAFDREHEDLGLQ